MRCAKATERGGQKWNGVPGEVNLNWKLLARSNMKLNLKCLDHVYSKAATEAVQVYRFKTKMSYSVRRERSHRSLLTSIS